MSTFTRVSTGETTEEVSVAARWAEVESAAKWLLVHGRDGGDELTSSLLLVTDLTGIVTVDPAS